MSIFKLLLSIGKESTSIATRATRDTYMVGKTHLENKLSEVNEHVTEYNRKLTSSMGPEKLIERKATRRSK